MTRAHLVIAGALVTLLAATVPSPAAAAPKVPLAVVQGMPGMKVDVCINGKERASKMRYGRVFATHDYTDTVKIKLFKPDRRKCKGKLITQKKFRLTLTGDVTVVLSRRSPRISLRKNTGLGTIGHTWPNPGSGRESWVVLRHAAHVGPAAWYYTDDVPRNIKPAATVDVFEKGDQWAKRYYEGDFTAWPGFPVITAFATQQNNGLPLAGPVAFKSHPSRRYEIYLVGTKWSNARLVRLARSILYEP
jgi:hypothetical protein